MSAAEAAVRFRITASLFLAGVQIAAGGPAGTPEVRHRFMVSDHSGGGADGTGPKIRIIARDGTVEWEISTSGDTQDPSVLPNGNLLFCARGQVTEVNREKQVVFQFKPEGSPRYLTTAQRLPNGNTLVGVNPDNALLEVTPAAAVVRTIPLSPRAAGAHESLRIARQLPNGNYLVAHNRKQRVIEYDSAGREIRSIPTPGGPYQALRLESGNTVISCGPGQTLVEIDPEGKTVWQLASGDLPEGMRLSWMAGLQCLPGGDLVAVCWFPRAAFQGKSTPQALEITREKKVVWTFGNTNWVGSASNVQILD